MVKEKMIKMMDILLDTAEGISKKENATPEEIAILPALAKALVEITEYAVIEKKEKKFSNNKKLRANQASIITISNTKTKRKTNERNQGSCKLHRRIPKKIYCGMS